MSLRIFLFFSRVYFQEKGAQREYLVESLRPYKDGFIIKLKEIDSLPEAKELVGKEVLVPERILQSLEKNQYYIFQLIGCSVITKAGDKIGIVVDVLPLPEYELLVVRGRGKDVLIPAVDEICVLMNIDKKEIIIDPPEGLLDLNEI